MEINGRNYWDPMAQVREIELAVSRLPIDAPLKEHFEFLLGVIDAYERGEFEGFYDEPDGDEKPTPKTAAPEVYRELEAVRP